MAPVNRFMWQNFSALGSATLAASSTVSGRAVSWLKHQLRSKKWRSATGWGFAKGFNDRLRYEEAGVARIAYVVGNYATGALAATAIQTAMNTAGVDPLELTPSLWLDASQLDLADGADVATWPDVSGNANDLDTSVGTQTYVRSAINGRPAVKFGQDGYLSAAASAVQLDDLFVTGGGTLMMVAWVDVDHTGSDVLFTASGGLNNLYVFTNQRVIGKAYDGSADTANGTTSPVTGGWHVFTYTYTGAALNVFYDDQDTAAVEATIASGNQSSLANDFRLGGDGAAANLKGYIAEVLTFASALTEENRRRITDYLEDKYALTTGTTASTWVNSYTAAYAASTFTLARSAGAATFEIPWTTEPGMGADLGFDTSADDTAGTSYAADAAAYQGRHQLTVDLGSIRGCLASVVSDHNITTGATVTLEGSNTGMWTGTPAYTSAFTGTEVGALLCQFFAEEQRRYWRLVLDDTTNPAGYVEVGLWYVGSYFQPGKQHKGGQTIQREELTNVGTSDHGSPFMDDKPTIKGWRILYHPVLDSDRTQFETMLDWVKTSRQFFVAFDPATDEGDTTYYVHLPKGVAIRHLPNSVALWSVGMDIQEAPK